MQQRYGLQMLVEGIRAYLLVYAVFCVTLPAVYYHRLLLALPLCADQTDKVQEVSVVVWNTVVRPGHVLNLSQRPALFTLNIINQSINQSNVRLCFYTFSYSFHQVQEVISVNPEIESQVILVRCSMFT